MPKPPASTADIHVALYDRLIAAVPGVSRKGATVPYTSVNGNMFSYLAKSGTLALRLPDTVRSGFLAKYGAKLCTQYGVVQKEYVEVPDHLLGKTSELVPFFEESFAYASHLKPKATAKPKTKNPKKTKKSKKAK